MNVEIVATWSLGVLGILHAITGKIPLFKSQAGAAIIGLILLGYSVYRDFLS